MDNFISWEMLLTYGSLITITFMVVEFTKELKWAKKFKTKHWSFMIAFILIALSNAYLIIDGKASTYTLINIPLWILSAMAISLTSNGLSDYNNPVDKSRKE